MFVQNRKKKSKGMKCCERYKVDSVRKLVLLAQESG